MLFRKRIQGFLNRAYQYKYGLSQGGVFIPKKKNVIAIRRGEEGEHIFLASNIVTNDGDLHYAERGAAETPTDAFGVHEMCSAGTPGKGNDRSNFTTIASTEKAHSATYPKTNDADADNTGSGTDVVTWLAEYTKADFNAVTISHGIITNATPGASENLLTGYAFAASFGKTANDTLKVFVNHTMNGV